MAWLEREDGVRLWYEDQGQGPVLVLVHGWCMSSAVWHFQLQHFSRSFRVLAPDLRGHGRSGYSGGDCNLIGFSKDLCALLNYLNLEKVFLAGWSMGAQTALQAYPLIREKLAGIALIGATPCFVSTDDFPCGLNRMEAEGMGLKVRRNIHRALEGFTARMFLEAELRNSAVADAITTVLRQVSVPDTAVALESLKSLADADLRSLLPSIDLPAVIINGDLDPVCLPEASAHIARHIRKSRHIVMQGCGHAPFLSYPDAFNCHLERFLKGDS